MLLQLAFLILFIRVVSPIQCGVSKYSEYEYPASRRILGGVDAKDGNWPWLVALASRRRGNSTDHIQTYFKCGGSLISPRHVLTAAHCYDDNLYLARLGATHLYSVTPTAVDIPIRRTIIHPNFDVGRAHNDIALVILKRAVIFSVNIRPICLPKTKFFMKNSYEKTRPTVAGWGDVKFGSQTGSSLLQEVDLPIFNLEKCQAVYRKYNANVTSKNICTGHKLGGKDACQGDSGGPLMAKEPFGKLYFVIGVISHGLGCGIQGLPGVCTRVTSYLPWINTILKSFERKPSAHFISYRRKRNKNKFRRFRNLSFPIYPRRLKRLKKAQVYNKTMQIEMLQGGVP